MPAAALVHMDRGPLAAAGRRMRRRCAGGGGAVGCAGHRGGWRARALLLVLALAGCEHAAAGPADPARAPNADGVDRAPLVLLDPGHGPVHRGAVGARGLDEVDYNDAFAAVLARRLVEAGFRVELTRQPGEEVSLDDRARLAGERGAWLLLSLHHDSAQAPLLTRVEREGRVAWRTVRPIRGYSVFVSGRSARYAESLLVAEAVGRELRALGRAPTLHHAEPIPGENRPLLDARLGIYRFDDLRVLRTAACPAVLIEVGVLPDEVDEAYVSDPARREELAAAIVQALRSQRSGVRTGGTRGGPHPERERAQRPPPG